GTILIEAALWAQGIPPGCNRSFSIVATSLGNEASLESTKQLRRQQVRPSAFSLIGADCDAKALTAAQENWDSWFAVPNDSELGNPPPGQQQALANLQFVSPTITWVQQDVRRLEISSGPISIVTNPPWGDRIRASQRLTTVYQGLGDLRRSIGVRLALITSQRELAYKTGVRLHSAFLTDAGGIKANVFVE
ncbi:MAG: hypothetical protein Q8M16_17625, partial [Pirellulaceae bacterium]|nr:hypothetical protein [Pirellulaceae bacterium]